MKRTLYLLYMPYILIIFIKAILFIDKGDKFSMITDRSITPLITGYPHTYQNEKGIVSLGFNVLL